MLYVPLTHRTDVNGHSDLPNGRLWPYLCYHASVTEGSGSGLGRIGIAALSEVRDPTGPASGVTA